MIVLSEGKQGSERRKKKDCEKWSLSKAGALQTVLAKRQTQ